MVTHSYRGGGHLLQVTWGGQMEARLCCLSRCHTGGHLRGLGLQAWPFSTGPWQCHVPCPAKPLRGVWYGWAAQGLKGWQMSSGSCHQGGEAATSPLSHSSLPQLLRFAVRHRGSRPPSQDAGLCAMPGFLSKPSLPLSLNKAVYV